MDVKTERALCYMIRVKGGRIRVPVTHHPLLEEYHHNISLLQLRGAVQEAGGWLYLTPLGNVHVTEYYLDGARARAEEAAGPEREDRMRTVRNLEAQLETECA